MLSIFISDKLQLAQSKVGLFQRDQQRQQRTEVIETRKVHE